VARGSARWSAASRREPIRPAQQVGSGAVHRWVRSDRLPEGCAQVVEGIGSPHWTIPATGSSVRRDRRWQVLTRVAVPQLPASRVRLSVRKSIRPGAKSHVRSGFPQLAIEGGQDDLLPQRILPRQGRRQLDSVVATRPATRDSSRDRSRLTTRRRESYSARDGWPIHAVAVAEAPRIAGLRLTWRVERERRPLECFYEAGEPRGGQTDVGARRSPRGQTKVCPDGAFPERPCGIW
jgi:hypothetical protein